MPGFNYDPVAQAQANYQQAQEALHMNPDSTSNQNAVYQAQYRMQQAQMGANQQSQAATQDSAAAKAEAVKKQLFDLAQGRLSDLKNDPTDALVLQQLQDRATGKTNPYDQTTINALTQGQNDQAAYAAQQATDQLSRSGLKATDPAYQSRMAEINAARQGANQATSLNINQNANVANYGAQGQAVGSLGQFNQMHNQAITNQGQYLGGLYQQQQFRLETPLAVQQQPPGFADFVKYMQGMNQGNKNATNQGNTNQGNANQSNQSTQAPNYQAYIDSLTKQNNKDNQSQDSTSGANGQMYQYTPDYSGTSGGYNQNTAQGNTTQYQNKTTKPYNGYNQYGSSQVNPNDYNY